MNKIRKKAIFSFFSGAGFLDLGFEVSDYDVVYVNEIYEPFINSYKHARIKMALNTPLFGHFKEDITTLTDKKNRKRISSLVEIARQKNQLVGFIGGPPCPDFSVGGKNRGSIGENGKLSATYVDVIIQQKPDFFLFENVKGLWRTKKHREYFELLKNKLHHSGFVTTERLINSIEYGAPQDRERIILLGFSNNLMKNLGYQSINETIPDGIFPWRKNVKWTREAFKDYPWPSTNKFSENSKLLKPQQVPEELTVEYWFWKNRVYDHINASNHFKPREALRKFLTLEEGDVSKKSFKRLHRWRYSPTAAYGNNEVHIHPYKARRISVSEALAIQSLPKNFELPRTMTLSDMFKAIGNGVPFLAARGIAQTINNFIGKTA